MRGRLRRRFALLLLGAAVSPWLSALAVAAHLDAHASRPREDCQRAAAALHGHHHERGTLDHQHLLTLPVGAPAPAKAALAPLPAALARIIAVPAAESVGAPARFVGGGPDPPWTCCPLSVLRI